MGTKTPPKTGNTGNGSTTNGGSSSRGRSGGGGWMTKKSDDKKQWQSLESLLKTGLKKQLTGDLKNFANNYNVQDASLLTSYRERGEQLQDQAVGTDKAVAANLQGALANRSREAADISANLAAQGGGETDQARALLMASQNFAANKAEALQAFNDSVMSINSADRDRVLDTATARKNLNTQYRDDVGQRTASYYAQMADVAAKAGDLASDTGSNMYSKKRRNWAYDKMKKYGSLAYKDPGMPTELQNWDGEGDKVQSAKLNANVLVEDGGEKRKRPEGTTLNAW